MHWLSFLTVLIGFIALAVAAPWLGVGLAIGAYLLWRTC